MTTSPNQAVRFKLSYNHLVVGYLSLSNAVWHFEYSDEFKKQDMIRPIIIFPDKGEIYRSEKLWPYFAARIPSLKRPDIQKVLYEEKIDETNEVELLKRFGKRTISNPFYLEA